MIVKMNISKQKSQQKLVSYKRELIQRIKAISTQMGNTIDAETYQEPYIYQQVENMDSLLNKIKDINQRLFELGRS